MITMKMPQLMQEQYHEAKQIIEKLVRINKSPTTNNMLIKYFLSVIFNIISFLLIH